MTKVVVVIPTYNEIENLEEVVSRVLIQNECLELIIVDDNSPDGTGSLADKLTSIYERLHVLHRPAKEGLGTAYRTGLTRALELGADIIIQMDADLSHPPEKIPEMLAEMDLNELVIGSRYINGVTVVNWPIERLLISWLGNYYARKITGLSVTDITGGFRCMRRSLLEQIGLMGCRSNGYAFQIELNYRLILQQPKFTEMPFVFTDRTRGETKLDFSTVIEAVWIVWWLRWLHLIKRL